MTRDEFYMTRDKFSITRKKKHDENKAVL